MVEKMKVRESGHGRKKFVIVNIPTHNNNRVYHYD